jgi:hypothetical protein
MAKCYIFVCAGCDLLAPSERSDALTCSLVCRVRAHRSGALKRQRALATALDIPPAMLGQAAAVRRLRPDLADQVQAGTIKLKDAMNEAEVAFSKLAIVEAEIRAGREVRS